MKRLRHLILPALALFVAAEQASAVDFVKDIKPILEQACLKCHGPERPKAGLRLDSREAVIKGSRGGEVVVVGKADKSLFYELIVLPKDEDGRMPPEGEPLTKEQANLIRDWINEGLKWPDGLVLKVPGAETATTDTNEKGLPISPAEKAAVAKLQQAGVLAMRLAQNTNWLRVDFSLQKEAVTPANLALIKDLANLIELDLGGTAVGDSDLAAIRDSKNLTRLQLENTKVTDAGLEHLQGLQKLESLNLYGTAVTDKGLEKLAGLKKLKRLYLWQSKATAAGARKLVGGNAELLVNLGPEGDVSAATPEKKPETPETKPESPAKKPATPEKKPAPAEKKPATPEKKPATPEKKPAEKKPATPEKKPEPAEKKPATPEKKPAAPKAN